MCVSCTPLHAPAGLAAAAAGIYAVPAKTNSLYSTPPLGQDTNSRTGDDPSCCLLDYAEVIPLPEQCSGKPRQSPGRWTGNQNNSTRPALFTMKGRKAPAANRHKAAKAAKAGETAAYTGYAMVLAGPMYVSSPHGAPKHVEETGTFEYVPYFEADEEVEGTPVW